jgi:flagellar hook assembly protein FlgD
LVAVLIDEEKSPGHYSVLWNGKDGNGSILPSGIYFYSISAGPYTQIKKMVLLR